MLCQTRAQAEEALTRVQQALGELGLTVSAEKTRITTYGKGYSFLGFVMSSRSRRMRPKSERKLQDKVRDLTGRSRNLDAQLIMELNRVIQGTARYFATASQIVCLKRSMPSTKAAAIGSTGVRGTRRLNFRRLASATVSSILFATTRRGFASRAGS